MWNALVAFDLALGCGDNKGKFGLMAPTAFTSHKMQVRDPGADLIELLRRPEPPTLNDIVLHEHVRECATGPCDTALDSVPRLAKLPRAFSGVSHCTPCSLMSPRVLVPAQQARQGHRVQGGWQVPAQGPPPHPRRSAQVHKLRGAQHPAFIPTSPGLLGAKGNSVASVCVSSQNLQPPLPLHTAARRSALCTPTRTCFASSPTSL